MLLQLVKQYWQVSLVKKSPAETPCSSLLLLISAFIFYLVIISQWNLVDTKKPLTTTVILLSGFLLLLSYTLYTYIVLSIFKVQSRMIQTLTGLFACHTIIHVLAFPLLLLMPLITNDTFPQALGLFIAMIYLFMTVGFTVWQFVITVHIYKSALSIENVSAILAAIGLFATNILVVSILQ